MPRLHPMLWVCRWWNRAYKDPFGWTKQGWRCHCLWPREQVGQHRAKGNLDSAREQSPAALLASGRTWHLIQTMVRRSSRIPRNLRQVVLAYITEHQESASFFHHSYLFTCNHHARPPLGRRMVVNITWAGTVLVVRCHSTGLAGALAQCNLITEYMCLYILCMYMCLVYLCSIYLIF